MKMLYRAALALLALSASPVIAQQTGKTIVAPAGTVPSVAIYCDDSTGHTAICSSAGGGSGGDASAANQTVVQAVAGSDASKAIAVQGITGGKAVPISASSLPLPSGAATSANQSTANTSLSTIAGAVVAQGSTTSGQSGLLQQCAVVSSSPSYTNAQTSPITCSTDGRQLVQGAGDQATVTVAQTVTSSSAYATGNAVGGLITFSNAARVSAGSGLIQSAVTYTKSAQTTTLELWVFNANPSGSTCTDKTAFSVASADFDKVLWVFQVNSWFSGGTPSVGLSGDRAVPFALSSGSSLYGCLVTRSTPTYTSTSDVSVAIRLVRN